MTLGDTSRLKLIDCDSTDIGGCNTPFKTPVRYLEVKINQTLSMHEHAAVSKLRQFRSSHICLCLSEEIPNVSGPFYQVAMAEEVK